MEGLVGTFHLSSFPRIHICTRCLYSIFTVFLLMLSLCSIFLCCFTFAIDWYFRCLFALSNFSKETNSCSIFHQNYVEHWKSPVDFAIPPILNFPVSYTSYAFSTNFSISRDMITKSLRPLGTRGATVCTGYVHFALCVILIAHGVTFFTHDVILEQIFVGLTYDVKIELQDVIWAAQIFLTKSWPSTATNRSCPFSDH